MSCGIGSCWDCSEYMMSSSVESFARIRTGLGPAKFINGLLYVIEWLSVSEKIYFTYQGDKYMRVRLHLMLFYVWLLTFLIGVAVFDITSEHDVMLTS